MPTDDAKLKELHDHYKDTFTHIQFNLRQRERFSGAILIVLTVMLFQVASPQSSKQAISGALGKQLGLQEPVDVTFVSSVIWFLLLACVVRYLQVFAHVERQWPYLHSLEDVLSYYYQGAAFTREGRSYLGSYPFLSDWTHFLYRGVFPLTILAVGTLKIWSEYAGGASPYFYFNCLAAGLVLVSLLAYWQMIRIDRTVIDLAGRVWRWLNQGTVCHHDRH